MVGDWPVTKLAGQVAAWVPEGTEVVHHPGDEIADTAGFEILGHAVCREEQRTAGGQGFYQREGPVRKGVRYAERQREAEALAAGRMDRNRAVRRASRDEPVAELGLGGAAVSVLGVEQTGSGGIVGRDATQAKPPGRLDEPDQVLHHAHRRTPPQPPSIADGQLCCMGTLPRTRAAPQAVADHRQRRTGIGDRQPGILAGQTVPRV